MLKMCRDCVKWALINSIKYFFRGGTKARVKKLVVGCVWYIVEVDIEVSSL